MRNHSFSRSRLHCQHEGNQIGPLVSLQRRMRSTLGLEFWCSGPIILCLVEKVEAVNESEESDTGIQ
jgi:hypothetical protein